MLMLMLAENMVCSLVSVTCRASPSTAVYNSFFFSLRKNCLCSPGILCFNYRRLNR